jgi:hypothetical protein
MSSFPDSRGYCPEGLPVRLVDELNDAVFSISGSRIWYLVRPTIRDFINACVAARLNWIRSTALIEAVVKKIIELRRILSIELRLVKAGVCEARTLSELANRWSHRTAREWRGNKAGILIQGLTLQRLSETIKIGMTENHKEKT